MLLIESPAVNKALRRYREAAKWMAAWRRTVESANWHSLEDVRMAYPTADGVKNRHGAIVTVFNVKGGNYRLLALIHYGNQAVYEIDLLSHGEYDKNTWKEWSI
jgi:mRNA interferase HigB